MPTISIARSGQVVSAYPVMPGANIKGSWHQGADVPDEIIVTRPDGEAVRKPLLAGIGKNRRTRVWVAAVTVDGVRIIVNVTEGWDPARPSWNYTVKAHAVGEIAGCSKCGAIFKATFDLEHDSPLCPTCRKGEGVAHE